MKELFIFHPSTSMVLGMILGAVILLPLLFLVFAYLFLAPNDILFTFGKQNRVKYIMKAKGGEWTGEMIFPSKKEYIEPKTYDILDISQGLKKQPRKFPFFLKRLKTAAKEWSFFGMYWIGIPPFMSVYKYEMSWGEWKKNNNGTYQLVVRTEKTPYLFVKRVAYGFRVSAAETAEMYPVDLEIVVFMKAVNAYKPVFSSANAFEQIEALILSTTAMYAKTTTIATLNAGKKTLDDHLDEHNGFSQIIAGLTGTSGGNGVLEKFGYIIEGANIISVAIAGDASKKITDATIEVAIATQKKLAAIEAGKGEAGAMNEITAAKKERAELYKLSPGMLEVDIAEATFGKDSKLTTYVNGDVKTTIPLKP